MTNNAYKDGVKMTDEELLKDGMDFLYSAAESLYEVDGNEQIATLAWMVDNCVKYGNSIIHDLDIRLYDAWLEEKEMKWVKKEKKK